MRPGPKPRLREDSKPAEVAAEPAVTAETVPPCPDWLSEAGKEKYAEIFAWAVETAALPPSSAGIVARYASAWARYIDAERRIANGEPTLIERVGRGGSVTGVCSSPAYVQLQDASHELRQLEKLLGLSAGECMARTKAPEKKPLNIADYVARLKEQVA